MIRKAREVVVKVQNELKQNITTAILAALAFVIALVWRDAIQSGVDAMIQVLNLTGAGYIFKLMTAIIVTFICVVGIIFFSKLNENPAEDK